MRIGDDNLFEIGCRPSIFSSSVHCVHTHDVRHQGVECPSIGNFNTIGQQARVHHTVKLGSYCVVGPACLVVPTEDQSLDDYTVVYGPSGERRKWSGRGQIQEADLRRKHIEYLREMIPKFNRLRRGDGA